MEIVIGVENFGKIEKAEIALGDFTLFVGNNNSGKTYMMQLIYGVLKKILQMNATEEGIIEEDKYEEFGVEWLEAWERQINTYLKKNKEEIISEIFHNPIEIGKLYIKFLNMDCKYVCESQDMEYEEYGYALSEDSPGEEDTVIIKKLGKIFRIYAISLLNGEKGEEKEVSFRAELLGGMHRRYILHVITNWIFDFGSHVREDMLFLPASRTGLLLLYKFFFSEKDKVVTLENLHRISYSNHSGRNYIRGMEESGNELGLSAPVYDFLQFLLRHTSIGPARLKNRELLQFIEKEMLEGKLKQTGDDTFYIPKNSKELIPLYLSSSLINELAPIVKALSGATNYKYLFYDEVETCLHPLKQGEMARLLMRLVNSGRKLIVSTHSDTMAAKINNLLLLSNSQENEENRNRKLKKLKLTEKDLLISKNVHVYQFVNGQNGMSTAQELTFRTTPYVGYDFSLFGDNLENLVSESEIILE